MLYKDLVRLTQLLLEEGHFVEIVTNGTVSKVVQELLALPSKDLERLEFKISYHYSELKRLDIFDKFAQNVHEIENSPASFTLELMPYDDLEKDLDELINVTNREFGAVCHATVGRDETNSKFPLLTNKTRKEYVETWGVLDSKMFDFKMDLYKAKRNEFCYAGAWSLFVDIATGEARQCYRYPNNQNIFKDPEKPIKFVPVGYHCPESYCFNGHAHMAFGLIPEYDKATYYEVRDRETQSGDHWIKQPCADFYSHKLNEANSEYTKKEKVLNSLRFPFSMTKMVFRTIKRKLIKS